MLKSNFTNFQSRFTLPVKVRHSIHFPSPCQLLSQSFFQFPVLTFKTASLLLYPLYNSESQPRTSSTSLSSICHQCCESPPLYLTYSGCQHLLKSFFNLLFQLTKQSIYFKIHNNFYIIIYSKTLILLTFSLSLHFCNYPRKSAIIYNSLTLSTLLLEFFLIKL